MATRPLRVLPTNIWRWLWMTELSPGKVKVGQCGCKMQNLSLLFLFLGLFLFFPLCNFGFCIWLTTISHHSGLPFLQTPVGTDRVLCAFLGQTCPDLEAGQAQTTVRGQESRARGETQCTSPATDDIRWESTDPECPRCPPARPRWDRHS